MDLPSGIQQYNAFCHSKTSRFRIGCSVYILDRLDQFDVFKLFALCRDVTASRMLELDIMTSYIFL